MFYIINYIYRYKYICLNKNICYIFIFMSIFKTIILIFLGEGLRQN